MINFLKQKFKIKLRLAVFLSGSALILTMFILSGMLLVAISSTYVVTLGIKAGGIQAQSTKAYFIAESGIEEFLWQLRKNNYEYYIERPLDVPIFEFNFGPEGSAGAYGRYEVYHKQQFGLIWQSIGEFGNTKRSVEVQM